MSTTLLVVVGVVQALAFLSLFLWTGVLWARLKGTEHLVIAWQKEVTATIESIQAKVPESRLLEQETKIASLRTRIDQSEIANDSYREQVHKSMQRFNAIMRRNERALPSRRGSTDSENDDTPDEIPLGDVRPLDHQSVRPTRAELRAELRNKTQPK